VERAERRRAAEEERQHAEAEAERARAAVEKAEFEARRVRYRPPPTARPPLEVVPSNAELVRTCVLCALCSVLCALQLYAFCGVYTQACRHGADSRHHSRRCQSPRSYRRVLEQRYGSRGKEHVLNEA
jgi:succinate dehydrogenase/fumarate reductase-like Fe-S protein